MKKLFITILAIASSLTVNFGQTNSTAPSGTSTEANPYQIESLSHLSWLTQAFGANTKDYVQLANIDASETATWDDSDDNSDGDKYNDANDLTTTGNNEGWFPIVSFSGNYDGKGFSIDNLTSLNRSKSVAFFKQITNGTIKHLGLTNIDFAASEKLGGLVAECGSNSIEFCYATGKTTIIDGGNTTYRFGGFIGYAGSGGASIISNCYSDVNVVGNSRGSTKNRLIGGFVGDVRGESSIINCYSLGNLDSVNYTSGGFVGNIEDNALINDC